MNWVTEKLLPVLSADTAYTVREIAERTGTDRRDVARRCGQLLYRGLVERAGKGRYRLTEAGAAALAGGGRIRSGPPGPLTAPRKAATDTLRARLWKALRAVRKATVPELLTIAARGKEREAASNARRYLRRLEAAGYVREIPGRKPGTAMTSNGFKCYRLLMDGDTGPLPPRYSPKERALYDPNLKRFVPLKDGVAP